MFAKITALASALAGCLLSVSASFADENRGSIPPNSIAVFGGVFANGTFPGTTSIPFLADIESNYIVGGMYARDVVYLKHGFHLGGEVGLALRFGYNEDTSVEVWGGATIRHEGFDVGPVVVSPMFVAGLSAVTDTIGIEAQRATANNSSASPLFYLAHEVAIRLDHDAKTEFFIRTHHRSGAWRTLSNMVGGHNANVFGLRRRF